MERGSKVPAGIHLIDEKVSQPRNSISYSRKGCGGQARLMPGSFVESLWQSFGWSWKNLAWLELLAEPLIEPLTQFWRMLYLAESLLIYNNSSLKLDSIVNLPRYRGFT